MIFGLRRRGGGLVVSEGVIEGHLGLAEYRKGRRRSVVCVECEEPRGVAPTTATTTHERVPVEQEFEGLIVDNDRGCRWRGWMHCNQHQGKMEGRKGRVVRPKRCACVLYVASGGMNRCMCKVE